MYARSKNKVTHKHDNAVALCRFGEKNSRPNVRGVAWTSQCTAVVESWKRLLIHTFHISCITLLRMPFHKVDTDVVCINTIRTLAADIVNKANSGHPGIVVGSQVLVNSR